MITRDRWIYQKREVKSPWALHLVVRKQQRRIEADALFYGDWISNREHRMPFVSMPLTNGCRSLIDNMQLVCDTYGGEFTNEDKEQVRQEVRDIKESFKH